MVPAPSGLAYKVGENGGMLENVTSGAERDANVCGAPDSIPSAAEAACIGMF